MNGLIVRKLCATREKNKMEDLKENFTFFHTFSVFCTASSLLPCKGFMARLEIFFGTIILAQTTT